MRHRLFISASLLSALAGLFLAFFSMYAAYQHNPQGEIHQNGSIDWSYWLLIGFSWVFLPLLVAFILSAIYIFKKRSKPDDYI